MLRAFLALVRMELARLLRSPAVVRVIVLPLAFIVPAMTLAYSLSYGAGGDAAVVLVPEDLPPPLREALEQEPDLQPVAVADPLGAYAEGRGVAAVVRWVEGDGLGDVQVPHGPGTRGLYEVAVAAGSEDHAEAVEDALRTGARAEVEDRIAAHGVDPMTLPGATRVLRSSRGGDLVSFLDDARVPGMDLSLGALIRGLFVMLAAVPGAQLLPILGAHERESGVARMLAVAPPPAELRLGARLIAFALFLAGSFGLLAFNLLLPMAGLPDSTVPAGWVFDLFVRAAASGLAAGSLAIVLGEAVSEPSRAMSMAGLVVYAAMGAVAGALSLDAAWFPIGGLAIAEAGAPLALCVLAHLALVGVLLVVGGRLHRWRLGTGT